MCFMDLAVCLDTGIDLVSFEQAACPNLFRGHTVLTAFKRSLAKNRGENHEEVIFIQASMLFQN